MLQQKNKKQAFRTPGAAWLFFVLSAFSLLFVFGEAQAITGNYSKPVTGTLAASEWNNLVNDFVAKSGSRLDGNFSINTATSSGYALDIAGILRASHFSGSLSAADVSTGVFGQNTGGGDFNFLGNIGIGIGTSSPNSIITIANNRWISALNSAGTGYVNLFKVNANDELEIGGALNVGQFQFAEDSGFNTFVDMPVSATPSSGTIEGYTMKVDGDNILTVYSEANGTGGVQNKRIGIGTSTPAFTLDVAGIINASALYVNGAPYIGSQWTTNGTSLYYNIGNVGVGISNPTAKFEVSGGNIFINDALITSGTPKAAITKEYLDSALASSSASIITQVATSSFWQGSLTGNVYNANTGNIGIGTTNPGTKFEIAESSVLRYQIGGGQTTSYISGTGERTVQRVNLKNANANGLGGMWNFYTNYDAAADFFGQFGYKFQGGTTDSFKQFQVYVADIANPKMVVAGSGNVGIGTTDPGAKLHILDTTSNGDNSILKIVANNASGSANLGFLTVGGTGLFQLDYAGNMVFRNPQGGLYFDNQTAANKGIYFRTTTSNLIRMFIGSNGNIGIGTTTPAAALSVSGGNVFINDAAITSGTPKAAITREYLDSSLSAFDTATNLWKANGSNIYASSTGWNVGIGTTNPGTEKLAVDGGRLSTLNSNNIYSSGQIFSAGTGANYLAGKLGVGQASAGTATLFVNGGTALGSGYSLANIAAGNLAVEGNVGIGTTNPGAKLESVATTEQLRLSYNGSNYAKFTVDSSGNLSIHPTSGRTYWNTPAINNNFYVYNNSDGDSYTGIQGNTITLRKTGTQTVNIANSGNSYFNAGNVGVGTTNPVSTLDVNGLIKMRSVTVTQPEDVINKSYLDSALASSSASIITQVATSSFWQGSLSGNVYNANTGNIGIGTTAPESKLHVFNGESGSTANGAYDVMSIENNTIGYFNFMTPDNARSGFIFSDTTRARGGFVYTHGDTNFGAGTEDSLVFLTNGFSPKMIINSAGNVGIGTTNPGTEKLAVDGGRLSTLNSNNIYSSGQIFSAGTGANYLAGKLGVGQASAGTATLFVNGGTALGSGYSSANIAAGNLAVEGNVGIGTTNPGGRLHIAGTPGSVAGSGIVFSGSTAIWQGVSSDLRIRPAGVDIATFISTGVGIGTANPGFKLEVSDANPNIGFTETDFSNKQWHMRGTSGNFEFVETGINTRLFLQSGGNVGIGTTNPTALLQISSGIKLKSDYTIEWGNGAANGNLSWDTGKAIVRGMSGNALSFGANGNVDQLFINTSGNVGIGITNPGAKLDVNGTFKVSGALNSVVLEKLSGTGSRIVMTDASGSLYATSSSVVTGLPSSSTAGQTLRSDGNSWLANSVLYNNGTNVGIGTTNPLKKLQVAQDLTYSQSQSGQLYLSSADGVKRLMLGYDSTNNFGFIEGVNFGTAYSNVVINPVQGNVGIGTTNPGTEKLAVDGGRLSTLNGNNIYSSGQIFSAGTGANYLAGKLGVGQASAGTATLFVNGGTALGSGYSSANIAAGNLAVEGNVGIGTTNPGTQLEIYKTGAPSELRLQRNSGGVFADGDIMGKISNFGNTTSSGSFENANIKFIARSSNGIPITDMSFGVSNYNSGPAEAMRISGSAGNVGIGTTNPAQKLVVGNITAQNTLRINGLSTVDMAPVLSLFRSGSAEWVVAGRSSGLVIGLNPASYADANLLASSKMYFDVVGNVGIGTTNPLNKLDVVAGSSDGASSLNGVRIQTGTGANPQSIQLGANDTGTYSWIQSRQYGIAANNLSLNPHGGNVGIGITNPGAKLDVNGTFKVSGALNSVVLEKLSGTGSRIVMTDASGSLYATSSSVVTGLPSSSTAGQTLRSDGNSWLANSVLYNNGTNVGIGTTNPGSKLSVAGLGLANTPLTLMQAFNTIPYATGNGLGAARIELGHGLLHGYIEAGSSSEMNSGNGYFAFGNRQNTNEINEVMRFNSVGNVGIGTTNPGTEKLAVDGGRLSTLNSNNIYSSGQIFSAGTGANYLAGKLGVGQASAGTATLFVNGGTALGSGYSSANIAAGNLAVEGNVGIGTTNPTGNLEIYRTTAPTTDGSSNALLLTYYGGQGLNELGAGVNFKQRFSDVNTGVTSIGGIYGVKTNSAGSYGGGLAFYSTNGISTSLIERMRITSTGNVGIGTIAPSESLHIKANETGTETSLLRLDNGGTQSNEVGMEFFTSTPDGTSSNRVGRIYGKFDGGSYVNARLTLQSMNSGNVLVDTLSLKNGNVGVGTLSPGAKLDINGTFKVSGALNSVVLEKLSGTGSRIVMTDASGSLYATSSSIATGLPDASGISGQTLRSDGSNWVANSVLYNNGTNVGIGTTTPDEKLTIVTPSASGEQTALSLRHPSIAANANVAIKFWPAGGYSGMTLPGKIVATAPNGNNIGFNFVTNNSGAANTAVSILPIGNVGIGTTNPTSLLHVQGNYSGGVDNLIPQMKIVNTATSSSYAFIKVMTGTGYSGGYPEFWMQAGEGNADVRVVSNHDLRFWTNNTVKTTLTKDGNFGVGIANPNSRLHLYNSAANAEMDLQSVVGAGNHWALYNNLSDNSFRIWGNNDYLSILRSGNIGIGITNPAQKLSIRDNGTVTNGQYTFGVHTDDQAVYNAGFFNDTYSSVTPVFEYFGWNNGEFSMGTKDAKNLYFYTGGYTNNRLVITGTGNVGINTTNPGAYRLNVNGNTNISGDLNVSGTTTATNFIGPITGTVSARNVSTGIFGADTGGGDYSFTGNVGIGITNPDSKLSIAVSPATGVTTDVISFNSSAGTLSKIQSYNAGSYYQDLIFQTSNGTSSPSLATVMTIKGVSGNVGIGTTNPGGRLHIAGTPGSVAGSGIVFSGSTAIWQGVSSDLRIRPAGVDIATFISTGVGIGTTDPGVYRLKVAGDAAITGTLQTQTGSDFAEEFSVSEDLEPGTVVVMAEGGHKSVKAADKAYDPTVVGIVSDNPSIIAGKIDSKKKVVVAMMGVVSVKASDVNGPIKKGDLLTTANISGYAMKAGTLKPGTIIGKALEDLQASSAYIKVLVNLQ